MGSKRSSLLRAPFWGRTCHLSSIHPSTPPLSTHTHRGGEALHPLTSHLALWLLSFTTFFFFLSPPHVYVCLYVLHMHAGSGREGRISLKKRQKEKRRKEKAGKRKKEGGKLYRGGGGRRGICSCKLYAMRTQWSLVVVTFCFFFFLACEAGGWGREDRQTDMT